MWPESLLAILFSEHGHFLCLVGYMMSFVGWLAWVAFLGQAATTSWMIVGWFLKSRAGEKRGLFVVFSVAIRRCRHFLFILLVRGRLGSLAALPYQVNWLLVGRFGRSTGEEPLTNSSIKTGQPTAEQTSNFMKQPKRNY